MTTVPAQSIPVVAPTVTPTVSDIRNKLGVGTPQIDPWCSTLIFADSGVGKTDFIGRANSDPDTGPLLLIDCNDGFSTALKYKSPDGSVIAVKQARSIGDLVKIQIELYKHNKDWFKTVAIDDLTEVNDIDVRDIMKEAKDASSNPNFNEDVVDPRGWNIARTHLRKAIRGYKDLPFNLILTTYEYTVEKEGKPDKIVPSLAPAKLRTEIPGFMDIVGWLRFKDGAQNKRILQLQGTNRVLAKNRFELPGAIEDPTFPDIYRMVQEYKRIHNSDQMVDSTTQGDNT